MTKRLYKILEIIGILIIFFVIYKLFPFVSLIISFTFKILLPFILAFIIAFVFEPFIAFLDKKKINRKVAVGIIAFIFIIIIFLIVRYAIPLFIKQLGMILEMLPNYLASFKDVVDKITQKFQKIPFDFNIDYSKIETIIANKIADIIANFSKNIQRSFSYILQVLITPILAIYFLYDYPKIEELIKEKLRKHKKTILYEALSEIKYTLRKYVKGVLLVMVILILASSFCFLVVGIDYAFLFGVVIGVTNIIPYIGPYIGGAIVIVFTLVSNPHKVIIILIVIVCLQFLESNFLSPKVQSKVLKTHPILVLLSIAFFGELLGIWGMIIAVPLEKVVEISISSWQKYKKLK